MKLLLGMLVALPLGAPRPQVNRPVGLYFNAREFMAGRPGQPGTDAGTNFFSTKAVLVNRTSADEKCISKVPMEALWGYVESNGTAWRRFDGRLYRVEAADTFMVYSRLTSTGRVTYRRYYFSAGPAAPVAALTRPDLRRTYADNPKFLVLLKDLRWFESPNDWDKRTQQFRAATLYHQALAQ